jgi:hypothetical protein
MVAALRREGKKWKEGRGREVKKDIFGTPKVYYVDGLTYTCHSQKLLPLLLSPALLPYLEFVRCVAQRTYKSVTDFLTRHPFFDH